MRLLLFTLFGLAASTALGGTLTVETVPITEWKAVYGRIEARDLVSARARIGGTVTDMSVTEGDTVTSGQKIATVRDDKLAFQVAAIDAQLAALQAQLVRAESELVRGQALIERGVATAQRLDQLRTDVDVTRNQITATQAQRSVVLQQQAEGDVLAPLTGRILTTPVTRGGVVLEGDAVATIGGGGFYLRLAIPERHAGALKQGAQIRITTDAGEVAGRLAKLYPQIENGRVIADVEADALDTGFVDARVLVELPVGERQAILIPAAAVETRYGIDFVRTDASDGFYERAVVIGERIKRVDGLFVEIISGLASGDQVELP
ncbi:efflux RND transporter periplasmic adaptor subunit (plasmid) [Agrobacterium salinitolerans]|uniref:efflux RND transporter periplasmic adaptor subunit n=1 Tax=Agrobacterium salinitolerans TaxID=1183413 RepID=UPI001C245A72|nr:efflux RND transporter periplasmic adaptor subunit [Agrobacterium salinitolerans]QXC53042.1 efflux RND transporter periplasmic adaptor subunit [Agrobacterium salinitolerans]